MGPIPDNHNIAPAAGVPVVILVLATNPSTTTHLRLNQEVRVIDQVLRQANYGDQFDLHQHWAVLVTDSQEQLLRHQPRSVVTKTLPLRVEGT